MLIISRKAGESFFIGDNIKVTIFEIGGDRIRVGIDAPTNIPILRNEIKETREENVRASSVTTKERLRDLNNFLKSTNTDNSK